MRLTRLFGLLLCLAAALTVTACATTSGQRNKLEKMQYSWSGLIRWGDIENAINLIDPELRTKFELTPVEMERYQHVQISSYRDVGSSTDFDEGVAVRDIEIGVVNRHTMAERTVRYRETWRWDADANNWWVTSPLPDLWQGQ